MPERPLPIVVRSAQFVLNLMPGERVMGFGDGYVVAHPEHHPVLIRWEDGAMFCERITADD